MSVFAPGLRMSISWSCPIFYWLFLVGTSSGRRHKTLGSVCTWCRNSLHISVRQSLKRPPSSIPPSPIYLTNQAFLSELLIRSPRYRAASSFFITCAKIVCSPFRSTCPLCAKSYAFFLTICMEMLSPSVRKVPRYYFSILFMTDHGTCRRWSRNIWSRDIDLARSGESTDLLT